MSRFFAHGSDSETESSSEEEQIPRQPTAQFIFSDEEEDTKRVVRSAKEKRYEDLTNIIKNIRNFKKIKDMSSMLSSFEDLSRAYSKALPVIRKEEQGVTPKFYLRCLVEMEDFIAEVWEDKKNMSKSNSKSLASLRQKLRKYNKDFESEITQYRESPDAQTGGEDDFEEDGRHDDDESDSESEIGVRKDSVIPDGVTDTGPDDGEGGEEGEEESESDWGDSEDSSSETSDGDAYGVASIREKFLKKHTDREEEEKRERKEKAKDKAKDKEKRRKEDEEEDSGGAWVTPKQGVAIPAEKPKMFAKDAEIDTALVVKKLGEIVAARGKKRTDRRGQIELLNELHAVADQHHLGPAVSAKILFAIVSAIFDYNPKVCDAMRPELWAKLLSFISDSLNVLRDTPEMNLADYIPEDSEALEKPPYKIRGCILTMVERLDEEFTKLLKECDPHSNEYVERLKDESKVVAIIDDVQSYLERQGINSELCRIYLRKVEHLYYKHDSQVIKQKNGELPADHVTSVQIMDRLCKYIYAKDGTDRLRTRAMLAHIYHHALHDNWFQARDLMLMSHLQEAIQHSDPPTQILYNRTMATLGLCAFRHGNIKEAHACLVDLMMTGKVKELLAQGLLPQRQLERSKEQEKIEKQRQMPFHMHVNLELLECVYLVSAMLLEIPYMAAHEFDARRRMISKTFYQQLRSSERQSLVGPPESMREHVVAASKAMRHGDWSQCKNYILNSKMNAKVWDLLQRPDEVRTLLCRLIQQEALRTYLFTYSHVYATISMEALSEMFELPRSEVHSLISKMIINEELMASLDDPTQTVVLHRSEPSRLQSLALQLTDKVNNLVDSNERIFETKQGNYFNRGGGGGLRSGGGGGGSGSGGGGGFRDRQRRAATSGGNY